MMVEDAGRTPLTYIDTHAGRGVYDLTAPEALKIRALESGIARLQSDHLPRNFTPYVRALKHWAPLYPGSGGCIAALRRKADRMHLFELHPGEIRFLQQSLGKIEGVRVTAEDGYTALFDVLGEGASTLLLIDPSYEIKSEYVQVARTAGKILERLPEARIMIWYPVLAGAQRHEELLSSLEGIKKKPLFSTLNAPGSPVKGMVQSGLIFYNAPESFQAKLETMSALLARIFI
jgi:23S rRNA (adenine2030-N6)-methyltransferase